MEPELWDPEEEWLGDDEPLEAPLDEPLEMEPERDEPEVRLGEDQEPREEEPRPE